MDFQAVAIGGVGILALVFGVVEALKQFGVTGKASQAAAAILGLSFFGVASAIEAGAIPPEVVPYIVVAVQGVGGAVAAMGVYDFVRKLQES